MLLEETSPLEAQLDDDDDVSPTPEAVASERRSERRSEVSAYISENLRRRRKFSLIFEVLETILIEDDSNLATKGAEEKDSSSESTPMTHGLSHILRSMQHSLLPGCEPPSFGLQQAVLTTSMVIETSSAPFFLHPRWPMSRLQPRLRMKPLHGKRKGKIDGSIPAEMDPGCKEVKLDYVSSDNVQDALASPYSSSLERVTTRKYIEHYNLGNTMFLKTTYCFKSFSNEVLLGLGVEDFNYCQSIHREELRQLERWAVVNRLDQLAFSRQKVSYCYFSAVATLHAPGLADARRNSREGGN